MNLWQCKQLTRRMGVLVGLALATPLTRNHTPAPEFRWRFLLDDRGNGRGLLFDHAAFRLSGIILCFHRPSSPTTTLLRCHFPHSTLHGDLRNTGVGWMLNHVQTCSLRCARLALFKSSSVQYSRLTELFAARIWGRRDLNPRSTDISGHVAPRYSRGSSRRPVISRPLGISVWSSSRARGLWSQSPCLAWPRPLGRGFVGVTYSGYDCPSG